MFRRRESRAAPTSDSDGIVPIGQCPVRQRVSVLGQIVRMQARPASALPFLMISVKDDTGVAIVTWSGRRTIGGIALGRRIIITGVPVQADGMLTFVNPEYELQG